MTKLQYNSTLAGYMLGGSLAVIRLAGATTIRDVLISTALTVTEFSVVRTLGTKAKQLDAEVEAWRATEHVRSQEERALKAVEDEHAHSQELLAATVAEIKTIEYESMLDHLMRDLKALVTIAVNSIRSGYHAGISHNVGAISGVKGDEAA